MESIKNENAGGINSIKLKMENKTKAQKKANMPSKDSLSRMGQMNFWLDEGKREERERILKMSDERKDPYPLDIFRGLEREDVVKLYDI